MWTGRGLRIAMKSMRRGGGGGLLRAAGAQDEWRGRMATRMACGEESSDNNRSKFQYPFVDDFNHLKALYERTDFAETLKRAPREVYWTAAVAALPLVFKTATVALLQPSSCDGDCLSAANVYVALYVAAANGWWSVQQNAATTAAAAADEPPGQDEEQRFTLAFYRILSTACPTLACTVCVFALPAGLHTAIVAVASQYMTARLTSDEATSLQSPWAKTLVFLVHGTFTVCLALTLVLAALNWMFS